MGIKLIVSFLMVALLLLNAEWGKALPGAGATVARAEAEVTSSTFELDQSGLEAAETTWALAAPISYTPQMQEIFEEVTFVQLLAEEYARVETICAGLGLNNIEPLTDSPMVLIPNAGDLSVGGSNVAIVLSSDGMMTFIPRVQGQKIRMPMDLGEKLEGQEVRSLTLDEAKRLMAAENLIWTARDHGPYGNGHGLPGHIALCDPRYPGP